MSGVEPAGSLRWRRRRALVNPEYQFRFGWVLLVQLTTVIVGIAAFAMLESRSTLDLVLRHADSLPVPSYELHQLNQGFLLNVVLVVGLSALVQVLFGVYASHRLAGPILKMGQALENAAQGDYTERLSFRASDHLSELAGSVNQLLDNLGDEQAAARANLQAVEAELERLRLSRTCTPAQVQALRERLARLAGVELLVPAGAGR